MSLTATPLEKILESCREVDKCMLEDFRVNYRRLMLMAIWGISVFAAFTLKLAGLPSWVLSLALPMQLYIGFEFGRLSTRSKNNARRVSNAYEKRHVAVQAALRDEVFRIMADRAPGEMRPMN